MTYAVGVRGLRRVLFVVPEGRPGRVQVQQHDPRDLLHGQLDHVDHRLPTRVGPFVCRPGRLSR